MNAPRADLGYEIKNEAETRSISGLACPLPAGSRATLNLMLEGGSRDSGSDGGQGQTDWRKKSRAAPGGGSKTA